MFQSLLIEKTRWTPYGTCLQGLVYLLARLQFALLGFLVDHWCLDSEINMIHWLVFLAVCTRRSSLRWHRCRYAFVIPCPFSTAVISCILGNYCLVAAALAVVVLSFCHFCMASSSSSLYRVILVILVNACFMFKLSAASFANLSAISFPIKGSFRLSHQCVINM